MSDIRIHPNDPAIQIDATTAFIDSYTITIDDNLCGDSVIVLVEDIPALIEMLQSIVEGK
jgi:hypothetical protein